VQYRNELYQTYTRNRTHHKTLSAPIYHIWYMSTYTVVVTNSFRCDLHPSRHEDESGGHGEVRRRAVSCNTF
jgi:hypothetical protein